MVREYIVLATGCAAVGIILTFAVLGLSARLGISIRDNIWILAIPAVLSISLNVILLELYRKYLKKK